MPGRQLLLDQALAPQQPVHRRVKVILGRLRHTEVLSERRGVPPARGRELGVRGENARRHHRQDQVALATRLGGNQRSKTQAAHRRRDGLDVSVRARCADLECLRQRYEGFAP